MSRSNAPREQLLKPWHLALAVAGFVAAFVWIAPAPQSLSLQESSVESGITELDLAYLKAENASSQQSSDDVLRAATALVREQRIDAAEELLAANPNLRMSHTDELAFSLERSVIRLNEEKSKDAPDAARVNQYRNSLIITLNDLHQNSAINRLDVLVRSKELASAYEEYALAADFSERLALLDKGNSIQWYRDCAVAAEFAGNIDQALMCATGRSELVETDTQRFNAQMDEFRLNAKAGNKARADQLVHELLASDAATVTSLNTLATQLLANERPLEAARTYAKLAGKDEPSQSAKWLKLAARWSEAGGKPEEGAVYLDTLRAEMRGEELEWVDDEIARLLTSSGDKTALLDRFRKKIADGDTSRTTLEGGMKSAVAANEQALAREWNGLLIKNHPDAIVGWINQYDLSLAAADLPGAVSAAKTLVDLQPAEPEHHVRLAKAAEWSGDPDLATQQWLWLSERYPTMEALTELTRLSTLTLRSNLTAEAMRKRAMLQKPSQEELKQLVTAYELEGLPDQAVKVVEELMNRYGSDSQWLAELAALHTRHNSFFESLVVWERYEALHGQTVQSQLNRTEMLWRTQQPLKAKEAASELVVTTKGDTRSLDQASDYQIRLLAEMGWRYNEPGITQLVALQLARIEDESQQVMHRQRSIQTAAKQGRINDAINAAAQLQADTGTTYASLLHMRLLIQGMKEDSDRTEQYDTGIQPYLVGNSETLELRQDTGYWSSVAQYHILKGDQTQAKNAYGKALENSPNNPDILGALLWMYIGDDDDVRIKEFIAQHQELADETSSLWTPMGVAYNQLGQPKKSLSWFERQLDAIDTDYGLLLTYADALDAAGQPGKALKVRNYAINAIRPLLADGAAKDQDQLLQQYAGMVARFGTTDQKERFAQGVLADSDSALIKKDTFWQQEMAISWLMATQRHDMARVVLAKLHEQRLKAPAWQALAVAMKQNDLNTVAEIVQSGQGISVGDNMLALRQLGRHNDAFAMAVTALQAGLSGVDGEMAAQTYRSLRQHRPAFAGAAINNTTSPGLGILESSFVARHTFAGTSFGVSLNATRRQFDSNRYRLTDEDDLNDVAVTFHYGDAGFNTRLTAGYLADTVVDRTYFSGEVSGQFGELGKHGYDLELAMNEAPTASTLLQLRGKQNRVSAMVDFSVGRMAFARLNANALDISTRISERKVARGISTFAEMGLRGTMGSHSWSSSVVASTEVNDRADEVPEELRLNNGVSLSEIIGDRATTLSVGGSLSRGGLAENYPQVNSPRYFVNLRAGHRWPERTFGLQLEAGAGIRVIGGDELSIGLSHDGLVDALVDEGRSRFGMNYRYHF